MSYENIKIEKGLYTTGKSFTQALEALDPSENYRGTDLEGLDAYERQLKRFNIKVSGKDCDTVSKFFQTSDSAVLFPEFVSRSIKLGMRDNCTIDNMLATTTYIDSLDYRSLQLDETDDMTNFMPIEEGAEFDEVKIGVKSTLTELKKYGKMISASYEAIKFQKLDLFSLALRRIGENLIHYETYDILNTIDTNKVKLMNYTEDFTYDDLVDIYTSMMPYKLTTIIADPKSYARLLKLPELRDANAGLDFHATGRMVTPFGAEVYCLSEIGDDTIYAFDKNYAFERVVASDVTTDFDKLIDRQIERATVSVITGFTNVFPNSVIMFRKKA